MAKERNLPAEPGAGHHGKGEAVAPEPPDREVVVGERGTWGGPGGPGGSPAELDRPKKQADPDDAFEQGLATIDARRARGNPGTVTTGMGSETTAQDAATSEPGPQGGPKSEMGKLVEDDAGPGTWGGDSAGGGYPGGLTGVGGAPRIKGDVPGGGSNR
ncbi:hypothetical protein [Polyangium aurulentum]|uniref:hypothetical protein n=1 Tax=Polyangium aurulentum TaxID=2567896 RepID=UPI0010AE24CE|nr:hypothetical protein [Polyangium aurulentum]UQA58820.1 hypothetical protein E8A73_047625 [Polyangium aurulentum]